MGECSLDVSSLNKDVIIINNIIINSLVTCRNDFYCLYIFLGEINGFIGHG